MLAQCLWRKALRAVRKSHIDIHYHYVRENSEEGIINIKFVESIGNNSDIFTKNFSQESFDKQETKVLGVDNEEYKH
jgi:hypothetical protein